MINLSKLALNQNIKSIIDSECSNFRNSNILERDIEESINGFFKFFLRNEQKARILEGIEKEIKNPIQKQLTIIIIEKLKEEQLFFKEESVLFVQEIKNQVNNQIIRAPQFFDSKSLQMEHNSFEIPKFKK